MTQADERDLELLLSEVVDGLARYPSGRGCVALALIERTAGDHGDADQAAATILLADATTQLDTLANLADEARAAYAEERAAGVQALLLPR